MMIELTRFLAATVAILGVAAVGVLVAGDDPTKRLYGGAAAMLAASAAAAFFRPEAFAPLAALTVLCLGMGAALAALGAEAHGAQDPAAALDDERRAEQEG